MIPIFNGSPAGLVAILGLVVYMLVKDVVTPLLQRSRNGQSTNGNPRESVGLYGQIAALASTVGALAATVMAQHDEQVRINDRRERQINSIFERMDTFVDKPMRREGRE